MEVCQAKVLLFGEHTVVNGGRALAVPLDQYYGAWAYSNGDIDRDLIQFADYIDHHDSLFSRIDVDAFFEDLDRGLKFESTIPIGYGLGSSGALVAATLKSYSRTPQKKWSIQDLQTVLGQMESFFHGKSSGFDPLVSYLNRPVLIEYGNLILDTEIQKKSIPQKLFLIDTQQPRITKTLVKAFQEYRNIKGHEKHLKETFLPHVDMAIDSIIEGHGPKLFEAMEAISGYQYAYLDFLIDNESKTMWKQGLASDYFKLKICGAGGGGFLLGITSDMDKLVSTYPETTIIPIL